MPSFKNTARQINSKAAIYWLTDAVLTLRSTDGALLTASPINWRGMSLAVCLSLRLRCETRLTKELLIASFQRDISAKIVTIRQQLHKLRRQMSMWFFLRHSVDRYWYRCTVHVHLRELNDDGWWGVGVVTCLQRGADCLHMVQLMPLQSQNPVII